MHRHSLASALAALLAAAPTAWAGMYAKSSPVLQVDARSYDRLINKSNYTSIVEFYAPWCGHCQNLKPAYEKAAATLAGLARVAAVDCDADANKQLCGAMGVQGFPTLKIVRPGKRPGRPAVEDYGGGRTAGAIAEAVTAKMNNHVVRVADKELDGFLGKDDGPKAILFTEKGTTSALLRSIAIDYLGVIRVAQIRSKESAAVARFGIQKFPTLILLPSGEPQEPVRYDGEMNKDAMVEFLRQAGEPNPDPAPAKAAGSDKKSKEGKPKTKKADKPPKQADKPPKQADKPPKKADKPPKAESTAREPVEEAETGSEAAPAAASTPKVVPIPVASSKQQVAEKCLQPKSHTCILALVPGSQTDDSQKAIDSLSQLNTKYIQGHRQVFPFFSIPDSVEELSVIRDRLQVQNKVELVAINARRSWWRKYEGEFDAASIEAWVDVMRMGEGTKMKLPEGMVEVVEVDESEEAKVKQPEAEETETEEAGAEESGAEETEAQKTEARDGVEEEVEAEKGPEEHDEL